MKREGFLQHLGWTGTGLLWTLTDAGVVRAVASGAEANSPLFVQISDSHIGFHQPPNEDVATTLQKAIDAINAMPVQPRFVMHTGDLTHLSKPEQFDTVKQMLGTIKAQVLTIPGEHDFLGDNGKAYFAAFPSKGKDPWFSWNQDGVHYIALVNVFNYETNGKLGSEQIDWLAKDVAAVKASTPVVVFGHVPLYALFKEWGWYTEDGAKALASLAKFDSVTVLNGHIHQVIEHTEGKTRFYTAAATGYPQPAPGTAPQPGPLVVPHDRLLSTLGYRSVTLDNHDGRAYAEVADRSLA